MRFFNVFFKAFFKPDVESKPIESLAYVIILSCAVKKQGSYAKIVRVENRSFLTKRIGPKAKASIHDLWQKGFVQRPWPNGLSQDCLSQSGYGDCYCSGLLVWWFVRSYCVYSGSSMVVGVTTASWCAILTRFTAKGSTLRYSSVKSLNLLIRYGLHVWRPEWSVSKQTEK